MLSLVDTYHVTLNTRTSTTIPEGELTWGRVENQCSVRFCALNFFALLALLTHAKLVIKNAATLCHITPE